MLEIKSEKFTMGILISSIGSRITELKWHWADVVSPDEGLSLTEWQRTGRQMARWVDYTVFGQTDQKNRLLPVV